MPPIRNRNFAAAIVLLAASYLLAACKPQPQPTPLPGLDEVVDTVDTGLMTGEPCEPPCWQGIRPGDPMADTLFRLKAVRAIDQSTVNYSGPESLYFGGGGITFDKIGNVSTIMYSLEYRLELQNLIARLGEPDGYTFFANVETSSPVFFNLQWKGRGILAMVVSSEDLGSIHTAPPLKPDSLVVQANYFDPQANPGQYRMDFKWQGYVPVPSN